MSLLDFFKKKKIEEPQSVKFAQIPQLMAKESLSLEEKQQEITELVRQKVKESLESLKGSIEILRKTDLSNKKEEQKMKLIAQENLKVYLVYLERLVKELEIQDRNLRDYIIKLNNSINNFQKLSKISYEKATILIGGELGKTKDIVKNLYSEISRIIKESPELEKISKIDGIKLKLELVEKIRAVKEEIERKIANKKQKQLQLKEKTRELEKQTDQLRKSQDYANSQKQRDTRENQLNEIKQEIYDIKEKVDLKLLMNVFHSDERKMKILKDYSENFLKSLEEDSKISIQSLVNEAKPELSISLGEIRNKLLEIKAIKLSAVELELNVFEDNLKKTNDEFDSIKAEIDEDNKKIAKLDEKSSQMNVEIKQDAENLFRIQISN